MTAALRIAAGAAALAFSTAALAQPVAVPDSGDTAWLLGAVIVGLVTALPGLTIIGIGHAGWGHAQRVLTAVVAAAALATILYVSIGYSLIFDQSDALPFPDWIGGAANWMLNLMGTVRDGTTVPETGFVLFQLAFVLVAMTLLNALLAPRARTGWLLAFSGLWLVLVLVPVSRWIWGGGWLAALGTIDAAGGIAIFYCVAVSASVARWLVGRGGSPVARLAADGPVVLTGALLLVFGMAALAGGATLGAGDSAAVAMLTMVVTTMAAALIACLAARSITPAALASGMISGTVAAAAAGDSVSIGGALLIGVAAGMVPALAARLLPRRLAALDHSGGAFTIAAAATTGALLTAVFVAFSPFGGSGYADGMTMGRQIGAQFAAIVAVALWSVIGTAIAALMAGLVLPMRDAD